MKERGSEAILLFHSVVAQNRPNSSETARKCDVAPIEPKVAIAPLGSIELLNLLFYRAEAKTLSPGPSGPDRPAQEVPP